VSARMRSLERRASYWFVFTFALLFTATASADYPIQWPDETGIGGPGQWIPYTRNGVSIVDCLGSGDASTGGTTPQKATDIGGCPGGPSTFLYFDEVNEVLAFRIRVQPGGNPLVSGTDKDGNAPLPNATGDPFGPQNYLLTLDIDGDGFQDFAITLAGGSGGGNTSDVQVVDPLNPERYAATLFPGTHGPMHEGDDIAVYFNSPNPPAPGPVLSQQIEEADIAGGAVTVYNDLVFVAEAITQDAAGDGLSGSDILDGFHWNFGTTQVSSYTSDPSVPDALGNP
jgi:hypothetical protein